MHSFYFGVSPCTHGDTFLAFSAEWSKKYSLLLDASPTSAQNTTPSLLELGFANRHFGCSGGLHAGEFHVPVFLSWQESASHCMKSGKAKSVNR